MRLSASRSSRWLVGLLIACAGSAMAQTIDCHVSRCAVRDGQGQCRPEATDLINDSCDEWNAAVAAGSLPGLLPAGERAQKPMSAVQLRERVRLFNACVAKNTSKKVSKPEAIELCKDRFEP